jgi:hypothetical protein
MNTENVQNGLTFAQLNDTQKQRLVDKFLDVHPLRLNNSLVEYVLQQDDHENAPFTRDDITNNEPTANIELSDQWVELTESERDEMLEELQEKYDDLYGDIEDTEDHPEQEKIETLSSDIEALGVVSYFEDYPEIYQWFSCSDWLIRALESKGQCTLDDEFWGRQACGQSVTLDCVMQEIAFDWFCSYGKDSLNWDQIVELGL